MRSSLIFFEFLNDDDMAWIHSACRKVEFQRKDAILESGKPNQTVYIMLEGKCLVETDDGRRLDTLSSGDIIGEVSFVDRRKISAKVTADTKVVLACLDEDVLRAKLDRDAPFAARFYHGVASVLAFRLRSNLQIGIGKGSNVMSSEVEFLGEIDSVDLDTTAKAGARLTYLRSRLL